MATRDVPPQSVAELTSLRDNLKSDNESIDASQSALVTAFNAEPFDAFTHRVRELILTAVWPNATAEQVTVEEMTNSRFNQIIGISWNVDRHNLQHILRIPQFADSGDIGEQVAALKFVKKHTKIPAPTVIEYDRSSDNALGSPYMVQNRITGVSLHKMTTPVMNVPHAGWLKLAHELGEAYRQMLVVRSAAAGRLVLSSESLGGSIHVAPFETSETPSRPAQPYAAAGPNQISSDAALALVKDLLNFRQEKQMAGKPAESRGEFQDLLVMARELADAGYFNDLDCCLCHLDISPRNILVDPSIAGTRNAGSKIAAILGWRSAILAPSFMACTPPAWLWSHDDADRHGNADKENSDELDESSHNLDPKTEDSHKEIKAVFDEAAGPDFVYYAYDPVYRLARRLFRFALGGVEPFNEYREAYRDIILEWQRIKKAEDSTSTSRPGPPSRVSVPARLKPNV
ncbi:phosphotransferase enzyme family protein [Cladorrhinum samala]|uniref:Phosphotransferase enzyme family protein n=1 Tax=Cladorrhinum samala TaxID=585594 RepID=A0AAV9HW25_9PEZI|nr:phosphotransferase enzyme family protein [Cladorrhinum samala]